MISGDLPPIHVPVVMRVGVRVSVFPLGWWSVSSEGCAFGWSVHNEGAIILSMSGHDCCPRRENLQNPLGIALILGDLYAPMSVLKGRMHG